MVDKFLDEEEEEKATWSTNLPLPSRRTGAPGGTERLTMENVTEKKVKFSPIVVRLTSQWVVGASLKSTRHLKKLL